jgi:hypothetical protein
VKNGKFLVVGIYYGDGKFAGDGLEFDDKQTAIDYRAMHGDEAGTCLHHEVVGPRDEEPEEAE